MAAKVEDPRSIFRDGAAWWADKQNAPLAVGAVSEAEQYYPGGEMESPVGIFGYPGSLQGSWPPSYHGRAFVEGASWQEYQSAGGTMWASDRKLAETEALSRYPLLEE